MSTKSNAWPVLHSGDLDLEALYALIATGPMLPVSNLRPGARIVLDIVRVGGVDCWRRTRAVSNCLIAANNFGGIYNVRLPPLLARGQRAGWIETDSGLVLRLPPTLLDWADEAIVQLEGPRTATFEFTQAGAVAHGPTDDHEEN